MKNGKIKKVAALDKVMQMCNAQGASYNPSNVALQPTALASLLEQAQEKSKAVIVAHAAYALAVNARAESFERIPALTARITRMVAAVGAPKKDREEARMIRRLFLSSKPKKVQTPAAIQDGTTTPSAKATRSTSMLDRDSIMNSFHKLLELVQGIAVYKPNEPELQVAQLKVRLMELEALNLAAIQASINLSNARIDRDKVIDGPGGVVEVTSQAKDYIRARFGVISAESQQTKPSMNF
jgi:hypothetical protein